MKKIFLLSAAFALLQGCATTPPLTQLPASSIKGLKVPPYPENTELYQSACIDSKTGDKNKTEKLCNYSIKVFKNKTAGNFVLASTVATGNKLNGQPEWIVQDALTLEKIKENNFIEILTCRYKHKADDTVIALIPEHIGSTAKYIAASDWAYKVNLPSGQFEAIEPGLVDCENTALGVD